MDNFKIYQIVFVGMFVLTGCTGTTVDSDPISEPTANDDNATISNSVTAASLEQQPMTSTLAFDDEITEVTTQRIKIGAHKVECEGFHLTQCLLHTPSGQTNAEYFYDTIEGFDFRWGYEYELLVSISTRTSPLSDASERRYELIEIISQSEYQYKKNFEYAARYATQSIAKVSSNEYLLGNTQSLVCEPVDCASIDSALEQGQSLLLDVQYAENPGDSLQLAAVVCAESLGAFSNACLSRSR